MYKNEIDKKKKRKNQNLTIKLSNYINFYYIVSYNLDLKFKKKIINFFLK